MSPGSRWTRLQALARGELHALLTVQPSDRRWPMPAAAALATGLPLLVGASFDRLADGLVASLGALVFLYLPDTPLHHRMVSLMACAFAMTACYTLGVLSHFVPLLMMPALTFTAVLVTMVCRFYALGPPGSLFFIMAAAIGAYTPLDAPQVPRAVGLVAMGGLLACLVAFGYSLAVLRRRAPRPVSPLPPARFDFVVFDSVVIGGFVGVSLALAQALQVEKAYWVPVSCLAVIQAESLRAAWNRQVHRVVGTGLGLLLSWALLSLPLNRWSLPLTMMALSFVIELTVVRHYAFAVAFITPLTILLAEAATLGHGAAGPLIQARFLDTVLGCLVGFLGGVCLHSPRFREAVGRRMRRLVPRRLLR